MATDKYINIKVRTGTSRSSVKNLDGDMRRLGATSDNTTTAMSKLSKVATGVISSIAISQVKKYADAYVSLQNQLRQTVSSATELNEITSTLLDVSNRSRVGIQETAELYTQLNLSTENLNLSTSEMVRLTETISKSFSVSGKSAAESAGAIRQLGQAFSSGALRGDEFNSIAEGAPEIMRALQRSLGKTQGELRDFAATGGITAKILVDALGGAADVIDVKMNNSVKTLAQSMQEANNNMIEFVGSSSSVQNVTSALGEAVVTASENLDLITDAIVIAASVMTARMIPSMTAYIAAATAATSATLLQEKAVIRVGVASTVTTTRMNAAIISTRAMTIAARAASSALALVGGPLGAAFLAGSALFYFNDIAWNTEDSATAAAGSVDSLEQSLVKMSRSAKAQALTDINKEMDLLRGKLTIANEKVIRLKSLTDDRGKATWVAQAESNVKDLNDQLDALSEKQALIVKPIDTSSFTDSTKETGGKEDPKTSAYASQLALETQQLQAELAIRKVIKDGFLTEEEGALATRYANDLINSEARLQAELEKLGTDEEARAALRATFKENRILEEQVFQGKLLALEKDGSKQRSDELERENEIKQLKRNADISNAQSAAISGISLLKAFGSKSFKVQKALSIAEGVVNIAAGVAKALNNPYPANLGFAAQVAAQGAGLLATIKSANPKSSSAPTVSATTSATPSLSAATTATPAATSTTTQKRVVDIRLDDDAMLTGSAVKQLLASIVSSDEDIVLGITATQAELNRVGGS